MESMLEKETLTLKQVKESERQRERESRRIQPETTKQSKNEEQDAMRIQ